jgi:hypothetical protein
MVDCK